MWDIFGYLHTLNFVIVKSALHSVKEDVKMGTGVCFLGCIFRWRADVMLTARRAVQHHFISHIFSFHVRTWYGATSVPDLTRPDGKTNMFF